jgi:hypothetical protein
MGSPFVDNRCASVAQPTNERAADGQLPGEGC